MRATQTRRLPMRWAWRHCARRQACCWGCLLGAHCGAVGRIRARWRPWRTPILRVMLLFSPAFILNGVLVCFVRNDGNPRLAMMSTVIGSFSNIVLDYIFIFPAAWAFLAPCLPPGLHLCWALLFFCRTGLHRAEAFTPAGCVCGRRSGRHRLAGAARAAGPALVRCSDDYL